MGIDFGFRKNKYLITFESVKDSGTVYSMFIIAIRYFKTGSSSEKKKKNVLSYQNFYLCGGPELNLSLECRAPMSFGL